VKAPEPSLDETLALYAENWRLTLVDAARYPVAPEDLLAGATIVRRQVIEVLVTGFDVSADNAERLAEDCIVVP